MLYCLLLLKAKACIAMPNKFMSQFIRDLAEHYYPTALTLMHNEQVEQTHKENLCCMSTIYCVGYEGGDKYSMARKIKAFSDETVMVFLGKAEKNQLEVIKPTILKYGKPVFLPLEEHDNAPVLRIDNNMIFYHPIESGEEVSLFDRYNPNDEVLFKHPVGMWRQDRGLNITKETKWAWRGDLGGKQLRVGVLKWPPFFDYTLDAEGSVNDSKGFFFDILQELTHSLNFTTLMMTPKDGKWGSKDENGNYTGLIGDLVHRKIDIAPSGLYLVKWRDEVVDFTLPVLQDLQTFIAMESSGKAINYTVYLEIFMPQAWMMVCFSFALMLFTFTFFGFYYNRKHTDAIHEILFGVAASGRQLIQRPHDMSRFTHVGARMTLFIFALHSYLLFAYYTCNLKAALTSTTPTIGISSFDDARRSGYKVLVIEGSAHSERIKGKGLNVEMLHPSPGTSYPELIAETMSVEKSRVLNFGSSLSFAGRSEFYPLVIQESLTQMVAFALQQDSEYRELFNYNLKKFDEKGILDKLIEVYMPKHHTPQTIMEAIPLGYDVVLFPSLVMLMGIACSLLLVIVEKIGRCVKYEKVQIRAAGWIPQGASSNKYQSPC